MSRISDTHFVSYDRVHFWTRPCLYRAACENARLYPGRPAVLRFDSGAYAIVESVYDERVRY